MLIDMHFCKYSLISLEITTYLLCPLHLLFPLNLCLEDVYMILQMVER